MRKHSKNDVSKNGRIRTSESLSFRKSNEGFPWWLSSKESAGQCRRLGFNPWIGGIPWGRKWQPTPVSLSGKSHGQKSLAGYSPWGRKESDTTEQLNNNKWKYNRQEGKRVTCSDNWTMLKMDNSYHLKNYLFKFGCTGSSLWQVRSNSLTRD